MVCSRNFQISVGPLLRFLQRKFFERNTILSGDPFFRKKCAEQGRWNGGGVSPTCSRSSPSLATSQFANLVICAPTKLRHCFSSPVSLPSLCALFQLFYGPIFCVLPRGGRGGRWNVRRRFATPTPKSQSRRRCLRPKPLFSREFF